jgi:hypothetical protein
MLNLLRGLIASLAQHRRRITPTLRSRFIRETEHDLNWRLEDASSWPRRNSMGPAANPTNTTNRDRRRRTDNFDRRPEN